MGSVESPLGDSAFNASQLNTYLAHISLPATLAPPSVTYTYLARLFLHQITTIPYDNLIIHYSPAHAVSLDPHAIFAKQITAGRGRGGYCMENSILFHHMLRALGFDVYLAPAKPRPRIDGVPAGDFAGWVHLVNVVTLPGDANPSGTDMRYALDVGFGGDGPTRPLPLVEDQRAYSNGIGTQEIRLVRDYIPAQRWRSSRSGGGAPMWLYQVRNGRDREWNSFYAFADFEFPESDFGVSNYFTSTSPESFQTFTALVVKFLRGPRRAVKGDEPEEEGELEEGVVGKVMLFNADVKRNVTGRTETVLTCKTEEERVRALREYFGIELTREEAEAIQGRVLDLDKAPVVVV